MRIYRDGKIIPMKEVTWQLLCDFSVFVDTEKDKDVKFPDRIIDEIPHSIGRTLKYLGVKNEKRLYRNK